MDHLFGVGECAGGPAVRTGTVVLRWALALGALFWTVSFAVVVANPLPSHHGRSGIGVGGVLLWLVPTVGALYGVWRLRVPKEPPSTWPKP